MIKIFIRSFVLVLVLFGCKNNEGNKPAGQNDLESTQSKTEPFFITVKGVEVDQKLKLNVKTNIPVPCSVLVSVYPVGLDTRKDKTFGLAKLKIVEIKSADENIQLDEMDATGQEQLPMGKFIVSPKYDDFLAMRAENPKAREIKNVITNHDTIDLHGSGIPVAKILKRNRSM